ncbi:MAG: GntR family transcriptional regulator [Pseudomonadota bacterium]
MLSTGKDSLSRYMQIKDLLTEKIRNGVWLSGDIIPSEIQLAHELGVSQGTVRKAITELVEKNILTRKQGRGTFVSIHDENRALFHFFHITDDQGEKVLPQSRVLRCHRKSASKWIATKLKLEDAARIIHIERIRHINNYPIILENLYLPAERFEGLGTDRGNPLPNSLYSLYEKQYGIAIHSADEKLKATLANAHEAKLLELTPGAPLLEIERTALTLDSTPVELRISRCNSEQHHYENRIF